MQKLQQGFTLIELMIVVAIIGILAALAVPAYQDYTIRSKVSEGASLASAARTAIDVFYSENGTLPRAAIDQQASLGLADVDSYNAKYVTTVDVGASGVNGSIRVTLKNIDELGTAKNTNFDYIPTRKGGNLEWRVSAGSIPAKYLPKR
ncbi:MAG: pilin [Pseudomonadota bacterium]